MSWDENKIGNDLLLTSASYRDGVARRWSSYQDVEERLNGNGVDRRTMSHRMVVDHLTGRVLTVQKFTSDHLLFAALLARRGFVRGDVLHGFLGPDDERIFAAFLGALRLGGVVAFGDSMMGEKVLGAQLLAESCKFVLTSEAYLGIVTDALEKLPLDVEVLCLKEGSGDMCLLKDEYVCKDLQDPPKAVHPGSAEDTWAAVTFTSGTTGEPKGVMHSLHSLLNYRGGVVGTRLEDATFVVDIRMGLLPTFCIVIDHLFCRNTMIKGFSREDDSVFLAHFLDAVRVHRPHALYLYGGHFAQLAALQVAESGSCISEAVRMVHPFAFTASPGQRARMEALFPNAKVNNIYGTSETGLFVGTLSDVGFLGQITPGSEVKIVDPETGKRLPPGQPGELRAKTSHMMMGYLNQPRATADYFDEEGFARIGDLASYDLKGRITFLGRVKDVIRVLWNGVQFDVSPLQVESVGVLHESVRECVAFECADEETSGSGGRTSLQLAVVLVDERERSREKAEEIRLFVNARVKAEWLRIASVTFVEDFNRNRMGKIVRHEFRTEMNKR